MKNGCGIVARTEELTPPPGMTDSARSYSPRERSWFMSEGWIGSVKVVAERANGADESPPKRARAGDAGDATAGVVASSKSVD